MKAQKIGQLQVDMVLESEGSYSPLDFVAPGITAKKIEPTRTG